jgi:hypothetical protein
LRIIRSGASDFSIFEGLFAGNIDNISKKSPSKTDKKAQEIGCFNFGITSSAWAVT